MRVRVCAALCVCRACVRVRVVVCACVPPCVRVRARRLFPLPARALCLRVCHVCARPWALGAVRQLWDVERGVELCTLLGHTAEIVSLNFNTDGDKVLTGAAP